MDSFAVTRENGGSKNETRFINSLLSGPISRVESSLWFTPIAETTLGLSALAARHVGGDDSMKKESDFSRGKRGAVIQQKGKSRITIYLDDDLLEEFRARSDSAGRGYQTMINDPPRVCRQDWSTCRRQDSPSYYPRGAQENRMSSPKGLQPIHSRVTPLATKQQASRHAAGG